jgi:hypothetical protein
MPAIKCPSCEYRNYHAADMCINCGTPLPSQVPPPLAKHRPSPARNKTIANEPPSAARNKTIASGPPSAARNKTIANEPPSPARSKPISREQGTSRKRSYPKAEPVEPRPQARDEVDSEVESYVADAELYETRPEVYVDEDVDETSSDDEMDEPYAKNKSHTKGLVPYSMYQPGNHGLVPIQSTALEPYQISNAMQEYLPQGIVPCMPTFVKEEQRDSWLDDKLPWGFPRRPPDIAGIIIQIQQSQELPEYPNLILGITNMLTELIWLIPNDTMKSQDERLQVTTVRIRVNDKIKRDARLIGYLRGANLTLGDTVSFWGWHRKGSLIVRKGYNHTSQAIVDTHTLGLVLPALTLLILLGIGFLLMQAWPSMSSGLGSFLHMVPHKP